MNCESIIVGHIVADEGENPKIRQVAQLTNFKIHLDFDVQLAIKVSLWPEEHLSRYAENS